MDPTSYFVDYQIWLVAPMLLVTMVLHFFWQRHCDRKDGWDPALHRGDHAELDEQGTDAVQAPTWYGLLPIIPFVLMMTFSKLLVSNIKMSVEVAMLLSVFIGMLCELLRSRSLRTAMAGLSSFLDGMGKVFGPVVALIVCAELFAESLKAIGAIDTLLHSASNAGIGSGLMTLVMVALIMVAAVIMGSGNAAFLSFSDPGTGGGGQVWCAGGDHAAADAAGLQHWPHHLPHRGGTDRLCGDRQGVALYRGQAHQRADGGGAGDGADPQLSAVHVVVFGIYRSGGWHGCPPFSHCVALLQ